MKCAVCKKEIPTNHECIFNYKAKESVCMGCEDKYSEKKIYFKVYQDKDNISNAYYVDTMDGINKSLDSWRESYEEGEPFPVILPCLMSMAEFNSLPEFEGY